MMKKISITLVIFSLVFGCYQMKNTRNKKLDCFEYNTKAKLSLGYYAMTFDTIKLDSALYYNTLAFSECQNSKKILTTRLTILDLQENYNHAIKTINSLLEIDSVTFSEKLDYNFKKFVYYLCIDSIKYKDSMKKEYTYLLNQPKKWSDSIKYQYRLGLLEYQLFGKDKAMKRLSIVKDYNIFMKGIILNIENNQIPPLLLLVREANIYHPLNDNRERVHIGD